MLSSLSDHVRRIILFKMVGTSRIPFIKKFFLYCLFCPVDCLITSAKLNEYRERARAVFSYGYDSYMKYAYPLDELRPLSCDGIDTWGSNSLTLIDSLDTLVVLGNYSEFRRAVQLVLSQANFDKDLNVSVFETNIRVVGGLLSAHLLSKKAGLSLEPAWPCEGPLLRLAVNVANRLLPAFNTTTGMPYGTVNLRYGVPPGETSITCTAGVGTFVVEFATLSLLTGNPLYREVAVKALHALWSIRSRLNLVGNHLDVMTGKWTATEASIGAGVDSYFEYLVKGALVLRESWLLEQFEVYRTAINRYLRRDDWFFPTRMQSGEPTTPYFQSLESFWSGTLSLVGYIEDGRRSLYNYHQVWKQFGFVPEFYDISREQPADKRENYPLRPEFIESVLYLYQATKDSHFIEMGVDVLTSIEHSARTKCGFATVKDVTTHVLENRMESFFLAETVKYLYLLFDVDNFVHGSVSKFEVFNVTTRDGNTRECVSDSGGYLFNTEAHLLDMALLDCCRVETLAYDIQKKMARSAALKNRTSGNATKRLRLINSFADVPSRTNATVMEIVSQCVPDKSAGIALGGDRLNNTENAPISINHRTKAKEDWLTCLTLSAVNQFAVRGQIIDPSD